MKATGAMKDPPPNTTVALAVDRVKSFGDSDTIKAAYREAAMKGLREFNGALAKVVAGAKKS